MEYNLKSAQGERPGNMRHTKGTHTVLRFAGKALDEDKPTLTKPIDDRSDSADAGDKGYQNAQSIQEGSELRDVAYALSHGLRSPSEAIGMLLNEFQQQHSKGLDTDGQLLLDLMKQTTQDMQNLVTDVFKYADSVGKPWHLETVKLHSIANTAARAAAARYDLPLGSIRVGSIPGMTGDERQLRTLFECLIDNAAKFCPVGACPQVRIWGEDDDGGKLRVIFQDRGIGIKGDAHTRIFDMFSKLHRTEDYPGNGLGLSFARRIAMQHGGDVQVDSAPGVGSTFTVHLNKGLQ